MQTIPEAERKALLTQMVKTGDPEAALAGARAVLAAIDGHRISRTPVGARVFALRCAVRAAMLLREAYQEGERRGGSIRWEDLDDAHRAALGLR